MAILGFGEAAEKDIMRVCDFVFSSVLRIIQRIGGERVHEVAGCI